MEMGVEQSDNQYVTIYVNGKKHRVPHDLTIMDAMEHVGFRFIRGSGCRQGMCGACATLYRIRGDYKLRTALACQELVEDGMDLFMQQYSPAEKTIYDFKEVGASRNVMQEFYPEIARCVSCNTCTRACPQELDVMQIIQYAKRGDFVNVSELSFECIECGLCAIRCPAEIAPYYVARLARRVYGRHIAGLSEQVEKRRKEIEEGEFDEALEDVSKMDIQRIREQYSKRDFV
jgi:succinate dehydrogenase/fumarate reductase-like Fe-S protein